MVLVVIVVVVVVVVVVTAVGVVVFVVTSEFKRFNYEYFQNQFRSSAHSRKVLVYSNVTGLSEIKHIISMKGIS